MLRIIVDADACPVKEEIYRAARKYELDVIIVTNSYMRVPEEHNIKLELVNNDPDAADDWIVENLNTNDIVVTADIPLASRCLKKRALVINSTGKIFTADNIGQILATRNLLAELRDSGEIGGGGPPPITKKDKSLFLQKLNELIIKQLAC